MNIITQIAIAEEFTKDGKKWCMTPKHLAETMFGGNTAKAQKEMNDMIKEGYLSCRSNGSIRRKGESKLYFFTKLGDAILLT